MTKKLNFLLLCYNWYHWKELENTYNMVFKFVFYDRYEESYVILEVEKFGEFVSFVLLEKQ